MDKKELQQLIKEEITKQPFNNDTMKKEELQKLQEALTDVMKYQMDEPDHEGEMAKSQMLKTMKYAADIMNMIDDTTELPAWVQSKLTKIADYIGAVKHYMESKTVRHVVTNMMESEDIKLGDLINREHVKRNESLVNERKVYKQVKVDDDTMVQIVGDRKGFRELTAALNPKTGKPIQKFGYDKGNEIADSKEELIKKLQKKYGKGIKFESVVNERRRPPKMKKGKREDDVKDVRSMLSSLGSGAMDSSKDYKDFQKLKKKALKIMDDMLRIASRQV